MADTRTHESLVERRAVRASSDRAFGLTVGGILALLALWRVYRDRPSEGVTIAIAVTAGLLLAFAIIAPRLLSPLNRGWTRLGLLMASVVNPLVMLVMFALVFTPIAVFMRLAGRDLLGLRKGGMPSTYWIDLRQAGAVPGSMLNQF